MKMMSLYLLLNLRRNLVRIWLRLKTIQLSKLAVLKNNRIEAVMISKDDYEKLKGALDWYEKNSIYK